MVKEITGRHVLIGFVSAFGIIFSVNMFLLYNAVSTFPGLEVKNSYVASQSFNNLSEAQRELNWTPDAVYKDGKLHVTLTGESGALVFPDELNMRIGRPTHGREDQSAVLERNFDGYWYDIDLDEGKWFVYLKTTSFDGVAFSTRLAVYVTQTDG